MSASYFLGNRLLGTSPRHPYWDDTMFASASLAFLCPTCGDTWGRVMVPGLEWLPIRRGCRQHPWCEEVGGSFIPPWRQGCPVELPPEVLRYELQLRLAQFPEELKHELA